MSLEIREVKQFRDMRLFTQIPSFISAYKDMNINPPPDTMQNYNPAFNPVHRHLNAAYFMAIREQKPVGRIAAIRDSLNPRYDTGFFGCFECEPDPEAALGLMMAAQQWLQEHHCPRMIGPATFNTNQQVGVLIEGFELGPQAMLPYNPAYYGDLIEKTGLVKETDLLTFSWENGLEVPVRIARICRRVEKNNQVSIRRLNLLNPYHSASLIKQVFNDSMAANWGFIPFTLDESLSFVNLCRQQADHDLLLGAWVDNEPAGVLLCLPTSLNGPNRSIRVAILGVTPRFRLRGLDAYLMEHGLGIMEQKNYQQVDISMIHEDNQIMLKTIKQFTGTTLNRRYRVYTTH